MASASKHLGELGTRPDPAGARWLEEHKGQWAAVLGAYPPVAIAAWPLQLLPLPYSSCSLTPLPGLERHLALGPLGT